MGVPKRKTAKRRSTTAQKRNREIVIGGVKVVLRSNPCKGNIPRKVLRAAVAATIASRRPSNAGR